MLRAIDLELGHLRGSGDVSNGFHGGHDEGQNAGKDQRRVHREGVGEHPQERDAVGWEKSEIAGVGGGGGGVSRRLGVATGIRVISVVQN